MTHERCLFENKKKDDKEELKEERKPILSFSEYFIYKREGFIDSQIAQIELKEMKY